MTMHNRLIDFATSEVPGAIVLRGRWGVGKTHFWKTAIVPQIVEAKKLYGYVSLFGINSLQELKLAVAASLNTAPSVAKSSWLRSLFRRDNLRHVPEVASAISIPGVDLAALLSGAAFLAVRERTICFDDLERRGDGLSLRDVMGLMTFLVEQRKCRIVAILNDGAIADDDWEKHREKVFNGEVSFSRTTEEVIEIGLADVSSERWSHSMRRSLIALRIDNIRTVAKCVTALKYCQETLGPNASADVLSRIAEVVPLCVWCAYARGDGAPPLDFLIKFSTVGFMDMDAAEETEVEKRWLNVLREIPIDFGHELDIAIAEAVRNGYPSKEDLLDAARSFGQRSERDKEHQAYKAFWPKYRDTMKDNASEIVTTLKKVWPPVSRFESANNLDGIVRVLRLVEEDDLASAFIHAWISERSDDRVHEMDTDAVNEFFPIRDEEFITRLAEVSKSDSIATLSDILNFPNETHRLDNSIAAAIAQATPQQIVDFWDKNDGKRMNLAIRSVLRWRGILDEPHRTAYENVASAARLMAMRSPLNRDRVERVLEFSVTS